MHISSIPGLETDLLFHRLPKVPEREEKLSTLAPIQSTAQMSVSQVRSQLDPRTIDNRKAFEIPPVVPDPLPPPWSGWRLPFRRPMCVCFCASRVRRCPTFTWRNRYREVDKFPVQPSTNLSLLVEIGRAHHAKFLAVYPIWV